MRRKASAVVLALALAPAAASAQQFVDWTNTVNVSVRGSNTLEKVRGCDGCDDAGAISRQVIRSGDGFAEFTIADAEGFWVAGLSQRLGNRIGEIDYAFRFNGGGWADVLENGVYQPGGDTEYNAGDVFRIAVQNGRVQYIRNGRVLHTSLKTPRYPLVLNAALGTIGSAVRNARIETGARAMTRGDDGFGGAGTRYGRFEALDRNGDGFIRRNEWRGARRDFDALDTNRNGVVTRREFLTEAGGAATSGEMFRVDPTVRWTDTGLFIQAGETISFDASGTIQLSDNPSDKANPDGSWLNRRANNAPARQSSAGALLVRIGTSPPIAVGDRGTIQRVESAGRLFLGVNDDYLADNSGEYRVTVVVER